jgi:hypothetical protein
MSMDDEICQKSQAPAFHPVETQTSATAVLQAALGCVQDLLPLPPPPVVALSAPVPSPVFVTSQVPSSFVGLRSSGCLHAVCPSFGELSCCVLTRWNKVQIMYRLVRKSSFLPAHRNVVPEEMWPGDGADEFLLDMIERGWAIGKGLDMDIME